MPWYVMQTYTGREERLVEMIRRILPKNCYGECFTPCSEQIRHRGQENQIHVLRLFPGYVFLSSDHIEKAFQALKQVPAMTKILTAGEFAFTPLYEDEAEFLLGMMDEEHTVRLSYVATDGRDHVSYISGPLEKYRDRIRTYQFRKRYAAVQVKVAGQEKEVRMGIILNNDIRRESADGKIECVGRQKQTSALMPGDRVLVTEGAFEGNVAEVSQVKRDFVKISVQMFGREISAEIPAQSVVQIS